MVILCELEKVPERFTLFSKEETRTAHSPQSGGCTREKEGCVIIRVCSRWGLGQLK